MNQVLEGKMSQNFNFQFLQRIELFFLAFITVDSKIEKILVLFHKSDQSSMQNH